MGSCNNNNSKTDYLHFLLFKFHVVSASALCSLYHYFLQKILALVCPNNSKSFISSFFFCLLFSVGKIAVENNNWNSMGKKWKIRKKTTKTTENGNIEIRTDRNAIYYNNTAFSANDWKKAKKNKLNLKVR